MDFINNFINNFIKNNPSLIFCIICILLVLIILAGLIIYAMLVKKRKNIHEYEKTIYKLDKLEMKYSEVYKKLEKQESENSELKRENGELKKLTEEDSNPIVSKTTAARKSSNIPKSELPKESTNDKKIDSSQSSVRDVASAADIQEGKNIKEAKEELKEGTKEDNTKKSKIESSKEKTMYASFPRSVGERTYFSDLSENLKEDSFFLLDISIASGEATFKPLDFMKIRNFDAAMVAMLTEGVKQNFATSVIGIEPGKAHLEGKDWVIDNLAKIKLA